MVFIQKFELDKDVRGCCIGDNCEFFVSFGDKKCIIFGSSEQSQNEES
jgi:hypothetical protein